MAQKKMTITTKLMCFTFKENITVFSFDGGYIYIEIDKYR